MRPEALPGFYAAVAKGNLFDTSDTRSLDMCIGDHRGLFHVSVLVEKESGHSIIHRQGYLDAPFLVTMCDLFAAYDEVKVITDGHIVPARRWSTDQEFSGMPTCIACLGG